MNYIQNSNNSLANDENLQEDLLKWCDTRRYKTFPNSRFEFLLLRDRYKEMKEHWDCSELLLLYKKTRQFQKVQSNWRFVSFVCEMNVWRTVDWIVEINEVGLHSYAKFRRYFCQQQLLTVPIKRKKLKFRENSE